jgi:anti-anti-sigma factor
MQIQAVQQDGATVLKLVGVLAGADADALLARLTEMERNGQFPKALEVSGLAFVDSRGLEALVDAAEQAVRRGGVLALVSATPRLREVMELTELASLFTWRSEPKAPVEATP